MYKVTFIEKNENEYALYPVPFPTRRKQKKKIYLTPRKTFGFNSRNHDR